MPRADIAGHDVLHRLRPDVEVAETGQVPGDGPYTEPIGGIEERLGRAPMSERGRAAIVRRLQVQRAVATLGDPTHGGSRVRPRGVVDVDPGARTPVDADGAPTHRRTEEPLALLDTVLGRCATAIRRREQLGEQPGREQHGDEGHGDRRRGGGGGTGEETSTHGLHPPYPTGPRHRTCRRRARRTGGRGGRTGTGTDAGRAVLGGAPRARAGARRRRPAADRRVRDRPGRAPGPVTGAPG